MVNIIIKLFQLTVFQVFDIFKMYRNVQVVQLRIVTAHLLLPHYLRRGIVDPAYLGKHVLTCHGNRLIFRYGETVRKIPGSQISGVVTLKHCTAVLEEGKIFEIVPNLIWQENDISQQLNTMCMT